MGEILSIYINNLLSGHGDSKPQNSAQHEGSSASDSHPFGNLFVTLFLNVFLKERGTCSIYMSVKSDSTLNSPLRIALGRWIRFPGKLCSTLGPRYSS